MPSSRCCRAARARTSAGLRAPDRLRRRRAGRARRRDTRHRPRPGQLESGTEPLLRQRRLGRDERRRGSARELDDEGVRRPGDVLLRAHPRVPRLAEHAGRGGARGRGAAGRPHARRDRRERQLARRRHEARAGRAAGRRRLRRRADRGRDQARLPRRRRRSSTAAATSRTRKWSFCSLRPWRSDATEPLPLEVDGEPIGATPARFEVVPSALRLRVPAA